MERYDRKTRKDDIKKYVLVGVALLRELKAMS